MSTSATGICFNFTQMRKIKLYKINAKTQTLKKESHATDLLLQSHYMESAT